MKKDSLFKGTFILSISLIFSKIIGLIYIIPYYGIVGGKHNMILINYAYNYYVLLLELTSAGIPLAISKLISKYNEEKNYIRSKQIAKVGSITLLILGIIGFLVFIFGADYMASKTIASVRGDLRYSVEDLAFVIRTLSLAVPFAMVCGGLRGIFMGHEIMLPTGLSQVLEQVFRILFMMIGTYLVMSITKGNVVLANAAATLAAGVGAIVAVLVLVYYFKKYYKSLDFNKKSDIYNASHNSIANILKEIMSVSIPFVIVSSFFAILNIIDQNTVIKAMDTLGKAQIGEDDYNVYNNYVNKIVMISVAIAPAFSGAFLPAITRLYTKKDFNILGIQINKVILSLLMLVVPALFGMYVLTEPLYVSFYEFDLSGFRLMRIYLPLALVYSIYGMTSIIMQSIDRQSMNIYTVIIGLLFKYFLNETFVLKFEVAGAIYCSILTYILMIFLNVVVINFEIGLKLKDFAINLGKILISSLVMFVVIYAIYDAIISNFNLQFKLDSLILMLIVGVFGIGAYFFVLNKVRFLEYLFGRRINVFALIRRK